MIPQHDNLRRRDSHTQHAIAISRQNTICSLRTATKGSVADIAGWTSEHFQLALSDPSDTVRPHHELLQRTGSDGGHARRDDGVEMTGFYTGSKGKLRPIACGLALRRSAPTTWAKANRAGRNARTWAIRCRTQRGVASSGLGTTTGHDRSPHRRLRAFNGTHRELCRSSNAPTRSSVVPWPSGSRDKSSTTLRTLRTRQESRFQPRTLCNRDASFCHGHAQAFCEAVTHLQDVLKNTTKGFSEIWAFGIMLH